MSMKNTETTHQKIKRFKKEFKIVGRRVPPQNKIFLCHGCGKLEHEPSEFGLWTCMKCGRTGPERVYNKLKYRVNNNLNKQEVN